jgi:hypothetical protein
MEQPGVLSRTRRVTACSLASSFAIEDREAAHRSLPGDGSHLSSLQFDGIWLQDSVLAVA